MEILILHPGGLGDIILSLPAMALLKRTHPSARITLAANIDHAAPISGSYVDRTVSLSSIPLHNFYSNEPLSPADLQFWKSFGKIVSWTGAGDTGFVRRMNAVHPDVTIARWKPAPEEFRHVSELFVDSLGLGNEFSGPPAFAKISIHPESATRAREWLVAQGWNGLDPVTTMHPGAGSPLKRWPLARFLDVARYVVSRQKEKLLVIEGPAEAGIAVQITNELGKENVAVVHSLPLSLLAAVIGHSRLFLGNDSGIAHLAAALEIPSIVIFGPTLPRHWAPLGRHVRVLWSPCLADIAVEDVIKLSHG